MGEVASAPVTLLPWDSDLLGAVVARASVEALTAEQVLERLSMASELGATLTYLIGDPLDGPAREALDRAGARVVDERLTYVRRVDPDLAGKSIPGIALHDGRSPGDDLYDLAIASGEYSRFRVDPEMPRHIFERLYRAWIAKSVSPETSDVVFVSTSTDKSTTGGKQRAPICGMVAVGESDSRSDIRLLAVSPHARGRGVGRSLVRAANTWAAQRGLMLEQVVTQHANVAARCLYENCGYVLESRKVIRHLWRAR